MHAIAALEFRPADDPSSLVDIDLPEPETRPADLLVRVEAVSVNPVDFKQRRLARSSDAPRVLGYDAAGVVEAVGPGARGFEVGDRVWYAGDITRPGTNADLHAVDHRIVGHAPVSLSFADAAALPLTALTAWEGLRDHLDVLEGGDRAAAGGTILWVGGAGGVGSVGIQLTKALTSLIAIGTASRPQTEAWVRDMGADAVANHHDLVASTLAVAPGGVEYVFSAYTPGNVEAYAQIVKPFGRVVSIDGGEGELTALRPKSIGWHYELMFTRARFGTPDMGLQGAFLDALARLVDAGTITSTATTRIDEFTAAGVREGHRLVESGTVIGKVVVARP